MRIAFIGGTRFIGAHAAELAIERGHASVLLHRGVHPNRVSGAEVVHVDRADEKELAAALVRARPDAVVDTRAMTERDAARSIAAVAAASEKLTSKPPVVVLSSQDVYAQFCTLVGHPCDAIEASISESSPLGVRFPYRAIKGHDREADYDKQSVESLFESAVRDTRLGSVTVLRLPATYGPGDPRKRFHAMVRAIESGDGTLPCVGGATWRWTHAHARDVALAIVLSAEGRRLGFRVFNVGEAETPTMRERAEAFGRALGIAIRWKPCDPSALPEELGELGAMQNDIVIDSSRIRAELGFQELTSPSERTGDVIAEAHRG